MSILGVGGTGKSFLIQAIIQEIINRNNGVGIVLVMAPTGKAALNAGEYINVNFYIKRKNNK